MDLETRALAPSITLLRNIRTCHPLPVVAGRPVCTRRLYRLSRRVNQLETTDVERGPRYASMFVQQITDLRFAETIRYKTHSMTEAQSFGNNTHVYVCVLLATWHPWQIYLLPISL